MIERPMTRKLLGGAAGALGLAAELAKHIAWYVTHQIDGRARKRS
jgi:hypothetical protein